MRVVWCGFGLGVIGLQQQGVLPGAWGFCMLAGSGIGALAWAIFALRGEPLPDSPVARLRRFSGWAALALAAACAGFGYAAWRAEARLAVELPAAWEGRDLDLQGYVRGLPVHDAHGVRFLFEVTEMDKPARLDAPAQAFPSLLQLTWLSFGKPAPILAPGMRWHLRVRLKRPHGYANFGLRNAEAALLARNVRATGYVSAPALARRLGSDARGPRILIDRWRAAVRRRIDATLGDAPHRGIVTALAIGAQDAIDAADWALMRRTGTSHLVAISGLHIALSAGLAGWLFGVWWRRSGFVGRDWPLYVPAQRIAVLAGLACAAGQAALAGFNVPVQRALWMLGAVALASLAGRRMLPSQTWSWALGLVLLIDPWAPLAAGFWLSFGAVGAILYASSGRLRGASSIEANGRAEPPSAEWPDDGAARRPEPVVRRRTGSGVRVGTRLMRSLRDSAGVQYAVTLALAPLTALWFAQIPLIGPFANAFAIPWVGMAVTPVVLSGVLLPAPLDAAAFSLAHRLIEWLVAALQFAAWPEWALWHLRVPSGWTFALAVAGVAWCLAPRGWPLRWAAPLTWLPLLWPPSSAPPPGAFRLTALDVGQGSAILVETARHSLLFDAGPGSESTHAGERLVVPALRANGTRRLDVMIVSHADADHSGGAYAVLDEIRVNQLLAALAPAHPLWQRARASGAGPLRCMAGQRWQWDGVEFAMLWPDPGPLRGRPNEHNCVLRVSAAAQGTGAVMAGPSGQPGARGPSALLAADTEAPAERVLLARDSAALRADILLVPHHGSKTSSTEPFLDAVEPRVSIFQMGYRNRFHHPHRGVFARYAARNIVLARTDADGAVRVDASGAVLTVERYRDTHRRYWMTRDDP